MKRIILLISIILLLTACSNNQSELVSRESKIPETAVKMTPETDTNPPKSHSSDYADPIPLSSPVNTAGAEDSPFIYNDNLYFFFTPDTSIPAEKQLLDGVTGIYFSENKEGKWLNSQRIMLQKPKKLALDGCEFILNNKMWFCSAREGYEGINWFTAEYKDLRWQNIQEAGFNPDYKVGELHITDDGNELYFHSDRAGGKGGLDIWVSKKVNGEWSEPENIQEVNTEGNEGWPFITADGNELWITKDYGLWRSKKVNGKWTKPESIISPLAGEATMDSAGNVYFTHHFFKDNKMIEADIYVAYKK